MRCLLWIFCFGVLMNSCFLLILCESIYWNSLIRAVSEEILTQKRELVRFLWWVFCFGVLVKSVVIHPWAILCESRVYWIHWSVLNTLKCTIEYIEVYWIHWSVLNIFKCIAYIAVYLNTLKCIEYIEVYWIHWGVLPNTLKSVLKNYLCIEEVCFHPCTYYIQ